MHIDFDSLVHLLRTNHVCRPVIIRHLVRRHGLPDYYETWKERLNRPEVLLYLDIKDMHSLGLVCRAFNSIIKDIRLYQDIKRVRLCKLNSGANYYLRLWHERRLSGYMNVSEQTQGVTRRVFSFPRGFIFEDLHLPTNLCMQFDGKINGDKVSLCLSLEAPPPDSYLGFFYAVDGYSRTNPNEWDMQDIVDITGPDPNDNIGFSRERLIKMHPINVGRIHSDLREGPIDQISLGLNNIDKIHSECEFEEFLYPDKVVDPVKSMHFIDFSVNAPGENKGYYDVLFGIIRHYSRAYNAEFGHLTPKFTCELKLR